MNFIFTLFALLGATVPASATTFDLVGAYAQSHDFWQTVNDLQNQQGSLAGIEGVVHDRYGKPDVAFTYLHAGYSYPHGWFESRTFEEAWITTQAEGLAGGEVSNPIFPQIQAYANTTGIASFGLRSGAAALAEGRAYWSLRVLGGLGVEKRLLAEGPELFDAIPLRKGTLALAGLELGYLDQSPVGNDFWITTDALLRPVYFHSSVSPSPDQPAEPNAFVAWRWRLQNEWLKQVDTPFSSRTRFGVISVLGSHPLPFLSLPVTWDYEQKTQAWSGLGSMSGIGGILRLLSDRALPDLAFYAGEFGGAFGGGIDLQIGPVLLNASSYALENNLTVSHDRTRLFLATLGISL